MKSCNLRLQSAKRIYNTLINSKVYSFSNVKPSELPKKAGVYIIWLKDTEEVLYVGRTTNLKQRLYNNHLQGNQSTARLKKYLVEDKNYPNINNYSDAKDFLKKQCSFQYILENNNSARGRIEGLIGYLTDVRYIESEH